MKMPWSTSTRILAQTCRNHFKGSYARDKVVRFSSVANDKSHNLEGRSANGTPAAESGKISAALLRKFDESLVLENVEPIETLQSNEVLVDVHYCALNASDALLSRNMYMYEPTLPMVLGYEFVGKLIRAGEEAEKQGYKIGDQIVALNKERYGGLAARCIADVSDIWKVPSGIKSVDAAGLMNDYVTAMVALDTNASIQEEDMILINVGISSVGLAAVDLATNVFKAQVVSVCATEDGAAIARDKGVLASFKYKDRKLLKQIQEVAADKDIKVIFDDADGEYFKKVLHCFTDIYRSDATIKDLLRDDSFAVVVHHLSREGRVIIAGTADMGNGKSDEPNNGFTVSGFNLTEYKKKHPETYRQAGEDVLEFIEEGLINPTCALTVGLPKVNEAIEFILKSRSPGKAPMAVSGNRSCTHTIVLRADRTNSVVGHYRLPNAPLSKLERFVAALPIDETVAE